MHRVIDGRLYRVLSLDSDPLHEQLIEERDADRLMRTRPTPQDQLRDSVRTRNGNLVQQVAR